MTYKLTYFSFSGVGEPIRFLFHYGGIPFEDNRIDRPDWPKHKPNALFGQMPLLEYNGTVVHQSVAITRWLAKKVNLVGKDDWENLEIDATVETINDLRIKLSGYHYEPDKKTKDALWEVLSKETLPFVLGRLDKQAEKNNGHLAVGRLTWADLYLVGLLDHMNAIAKTDLIEKYPSLVKVRETVVALPSIKAWIAKRPNVHS